MAASQTNTTLLTGSSQLVAMIKVAKSRRPGCIPPTPRCWPKAQPPTNGRWQKPTFIFTTRELPIPVGADVRLVSGNVAEHLPAKREAARGGDGWVVGRGDLAGHFLDIDALDEIGLSIAPVALAAGAELLPRRIESDRLQLVSAEAVGQFTRLVFAVKKQRSSGSEELATL